MATQNENSKSDDVIFKEYVASMGGEESCAEAWLRFVNKEMAVFDKAGRE